MHILFISWKPNNEINLARAIGGVDSPFHDMSAPFSLEEGMEKLTSNDILAINNLLAEKYGFEICYSWDMFGQDLHESKMQNDQFAIVLNKYIRKKIKKNGGIREVVQA